MPRHSRGLTQTATWWSATPSAYGGYTFGDPTEVKCHWEDGNELFMDEAGKEAVSRAIVYLGRDVAVGDFLYLGESTSVTPLTVTGAFQVRKFFKTPNLRSIVNERKALL